MHAVVKVHSPEMCMKWRAVEVGRRSRPLAETPENNTSSRRLGSSPSEGLMLSRPPTQGCRWTRCGSDRYSLVPMATSQDWPARIPAPHRQLLRACGITTLSLCSPVVSGSRFASCDLRAQARIALIPASVQLAPLLQPHLSCPQVLLVPGVRRKTGSVACSAARPVSC